MNNKKALVSILVLIITLAGCAVPIGRSVVEEISPEVSVDMTAALAAINVRMETISRQSAGGDLNDTWTLRLMAMGIILMPFLGYVLPKMGWGWVQRHKNRG